MNNHNLQLILNFQSPEKLGQSLSWSTFPKKKIDRNLFWEKQHVYPLVVPNIAMAGIWPMFHRKFIFKGPIFQLAMLDLVAARNSESFKASLAPAAAN